MKTIYIKILFLLVLFSSLSSCEEDLELENPNSVTVESYYKTEQDLTKAVNATYAVIQDATMLAREWFFLHDTRGDDMATGGGQLEAPRAQLMNGTNDPGNSVANSVWTGCYAMIHRANVVINKASGVEMDDETLRNRLVGEAKFLRSWAYFELVTFWGGVPLYEEYVSSLEGTLPRASADEVYAGIVANLTDAISALPLIATDKGRATKGAAQTLLAKVYMQRDDYASAKALIKDVIDSDIYSLVDNYNDNFLEETEFNSESVFEVAFLDENGSFNWWYNNGDRTGNETTLHNQEINPTSWGNMIPSQSLLEEFESTETGDVKTDPRYKDSFYEVGDVYAGGVLAEGNFNVASSVIRGGVAKKVGWRKHTLLYKNASSYYPGGINERVIRYAEVLLIMAECQNETDESEANVIATLNQLRDRVSVSMPNYPTVNYPTSTKAERFAAIVHEKRIELNGEEIRNRDILRWRTQGKLDLIGGDPISYYAEKFALLPIPQAEIDNNAKISQSDQNTGY